MLSEGQVGRYSECCNAPLLGLSDNNSDSCTLGQDKGKKRKDNKNPQKASGITDMNRAVLLGSLFAY